MFEYETLFDAVETLTLAKANQEKSRLGAKESKLSHLESSLPQNKMKLKCRCEMEMKRARGIA